MLTLADHRDERVHEVVLGPDGVVLIPCVFAWPEPSVSMATSTQTMLCYPARAAATTTALARALGVTPSAVSQHVTVLYRAGLVDRARSGRAVLYQANDLGLAVLDPPRRD